MNERFYRIWNNKKSGNRKLNWSFISWLLTNISVNNTVYNFTIPRSTIGKQSLFSKQITKRTSTHVFHNDTCISIGQILFFWWLVAWKSKRCWWRWRWCCKSWTWWRMHHLSKLWGHHIISNEKNEIGMPQATENIGSTQSLIVKEWRLWTYHIIATSNSNWAKEEELLKNCLFITFTATSVPLKVAL